MSMKASEIKELSTQEIQERIDDFKNVLVRLRLNHAVSPLDNPNKLRDARRDVARLKTELRMRQINEKK